MFKVLPQMKRLVKQVCERYGVEIESIEEETEGVVPTKVYADGSMDFLHNPFYKVRLSTPNLMGWKYVICTQIRGRSLPFSASQNNVTVVVQYRAGDYKVIPSWRGKLVPEDELKDHAYHIKRGYMLVEPPPEFLLKPLRLP